MIIKKIDKVVSKTLFYICSSLMFMMALIIFAQVIARYVIGKSLVWSEELGRYIFVWVSFLGMAAAIPKGSHVALDLLVNKLEGVGKRMLIIFNNILVTLFGIAMTYGGCQLVELGSNQTSPTLKIPMQIIYIVIPISGLILVYYVISQTIQMFHESSLDTVSTAASSEADNIE